MTAFIYSLKDELVSFNQPMVMENDEVAIRNIATTLRNSDHLRINAKDYSLYCLGSIDFESGKISPLDLPRKVVDILSLVNAVGSEDKDG